MMLYVKPTLDLSASAVLAALNHKSVSAVTGKKLLLAAARMLGIGFITAWAGLFALAFLAVYGGLPLLLA